MMYYFVYGSNWKIFLPLQVHMHTYDLSFPVFPFARGNPIYLSSLDSRALGGIGILALRFIDLPAATAYCIFSPLICRFTGLTFWLLGIFTKLSLFLLFVDFTFSSPVECDLIDLTINLLYDYCSNEKHYFDVNSILTNSFFFFFLNN